MSSPPAEFGPTHGDITADCVAKAFGAPIDSDPRALAILHEWVKTTREGDIGMQLGQIAKTNPEVAIGSYPFFDPQHGANTNVVLRARDASSRRQNARSRRYWSEYGEHNRIVPKPILFEHQTTNLGVRSSRTRFTGGLSGKDGAF
jgi:molybdopterin-biosynthesis enzyme MoeA-like protein